MRSVILEGSCTIRVFQNKSFSSTGIHISVRSTTLVLYSMSHIIYNVLQYSSNTILDPLNCRGSHSVLILLFKLFSQYLHAITLSYTITACDGDDVVSGSNSERTLIVKQFKHWDSRWASNAVRLQLWKIVWHKLQHFLQLKGNIWICYRGSKHWQFAITVVG